MFQLALVELLNVVNGFLLVDYCQQTTNSQQSLHRPCGGAQHTDTQTTLLATSVVVKTCTHSFTLGLNPSFSANPPYRSLSFFSFWIHYMADCLLLLLSISVFLLFSFFCFFALF